MMFHLGHRVQLAYDGLSVELRFHVIRIGLLVA